MTCDRKGHLRSGRAAEVDAVEGGAFAFAAGLEGFELVLGLGLHAVEVGYVFHDLVELDVCGKDAALLMLGDCPERDAEKDSLGEGAVFVSLRDLEVLLRALNIRGDGGDLEARNAATPLHEGGDCCRVLCLELADRFIAGDDAVAKTLPFCVGLAGDDGRVGGEAVLDGVAAGCRLASPRARSASLASHVTSVGRCETERQESNVTAEVCLVILCFGITRKF